MKKQNPKIRWHISEAEKSEIREMTLAGIRQSEISRRLKITAPSVSKAQREMGLPTRPPVDEKQILELFAQGWGGYRIAKHLGVAVSRVYKVARDFGFRRADGIGYPEPHGDVEGFKAAILRRDDYVKNLAEKYGVGFCQARKIAHELLGCSEFRSGLSKPPLSSNFPQKHHHKADADADTDA